jgi:uncharacterized membrane protein
MATEAVAAGMRLRDAFQRLSPEGQRIMVESIRSQRAADRAHRDQVAQVRRRVLEQIGADRLDAEAVRRSYADERRMVAEAQARRNDAFVAAVQRLSAADRKTLSAELIRMQDMAQLREQRWRARAEQWRGRQRSGQGGGSEAVSAPDE